MPKNLGLYDNDLSIPRKQDINNIQEQVNTINENIEDFVTSENPSGVVNTIPPTFGGYTIDNFVLKTGTTMTGPLIAQSNVNYMIGQVRNIYLSTNPPTNSQGNNGDIWIIYGGSV